MWVLVPVKQFDRGKRRLADRFTPRQRDDLCRAMAADLLAVVKQASGIAGTTLVSENSGVEELAKRHECEFLRESALGAGGLNGVVKAAAGALANGGQTDLLVLHADLPLLSQADLERMLREHASLGRGSVTVVTDRHRCGSNGLLLTPATGFEFQFGRDSCRLHLAEAARLGRVSQVLDIPGAALDIDTPEDVEQLERTSPETVGKYTARWLAAYRPGRVASAEEPV